MATICQSDLYTRRIFRQYYLMSLHTKSKLIQFWHAAHIKYYKYQFNSATLTYVWEKQKKNTISDFTNKQTHTIIIIILNAVWIYSRAVIIFAIPFHMGFDWNKYTNIRVRTVRFVWHTLLIYVLPSHISIVHAHCIVHLLFSSSHNVNIIFYSTHSAEYTHIKRENLSA